MSAFAWVPDDDPERDWEVGINLGVRWIEQLTERPAPILLTADLSGLHSPTLEWFEHRYGRTSRRGSRNRVGSGPHTVLTYVPYADELDFARQIARGGPIVVVETVGFEVEGWAAAVGAEDLILGEVTEPLSDVEASLVDRLKHYANNSFAGDFGKRMALSAIDEARERAQIEPHRIASALLGHNCKAAAAVRLAAMFDPPARRSTGRKRWS